MKLWSPSNRVTFLALVLVLLESIVAKVAALQLAGKKKSTPTLERPTTTLTSEQRDDDDNLVVPVSRRAALLRSAAASLTLPFIVELTGKPLTAQAAAAGTAVGGATQAARVETWPGIDELEPMYELKLSLDAMAGAVQDAKNWPFIQNRLERFFGGFIVNEKNFYFGVGLQYMNNIKYDKGELPNYVLLDKQARYDALELTMKNLENLKSVLTNQGSDSAIVEELAKGAQYALASWFSMIPARDVKAVEDLFVSVKKADVNRDGRLSDDELVFLSPIEQEVWKRKVDKFG